MIIRLIEKLFGARYLGNEPRCVSCRTKNNIKFYGTYHQTMKKNQYKQVPIWLCNKHDWIMKNAFGFKEKQVNGD